MTDPIPSTEPLLYSLKRFLTLANISRAHFYRLRARGEAPALLKVGDATRISAAAAQAWIKQLEAAASAIQLRPRGRCAKRITLDDVLMGRG